MEATPSVSWTEAGERPSLIAPQLEAETSLARERSQLANAEQLLVGNESTLSHLWRSLETSRERSTTYSPQHRARLARSVMALLQKTNQALDRLNAAYEEVIALTQQRLELAGAGFPQEEEAVRTLLHRISEQEASRRRYQREREALQQQLSAWQRLTRTIEPARLKLERIREEIEQIREENAQLEAQIEAANTGNRQLEEELSMLEQQIEADEQVLQQVQRQRDDRRERLQALSEANALQADLRTVLRIQQQALRERMQPDSRSFNVSVSAARTGQQRQPDSITAANLERFSSDVDVTKRSSTDADALVNGDDHDSAPNHAAGDAVENLASNGSSRELVVAASQSGLTRGSGVSVRRTRPSISREAASWRKEPLSTAGLGTNPTSLMLPPKSNNTSPVRLLAENLNAADDIEALAMEPSEPRTPLSKLRHQGQGSSWETLQHLSPPETRSTAATTASLPTSSGRAGSVLSRVNNHASLAIRGEHFNNRTLTAVVSGLENASTLAVRWYRLSRHAETLSSYAYRCEGSRYRTTADDVGMRLAAVVDAPGISSLRAMTESIQVAPDMEERLSSWMLDGRAAFLVRDEASGAPRSILVSKRHVKVQRMAQQRRDREASRIAEHFEQDVHDTMEDFDPREGHWITEEKKLWTPFIKVILDEADPRAFVLILDHTFAFRAAGAEQRDLITLCIRQFAVRYRTGSSAQRHECRMQ
ncbi:hypothetical protein F1559_001478 [Cyanidiococcus yangmingshanensis]|uniref:Uncharacterized protein n=1 Tax=Cyanidiococcus yangmingshanensis TaxID=2690220 RepID=A0A7J7IEE6_9RHOD|nr:hypothetical protein F1559_001478 [Cyanidiococcus yangmingshanensis]